MSACFFILLLFSPLISGDNVPRITPGRTSIGPRLQLPDPNLAIFEYDVSPNPKGYSSFNNGKILTHEANLESARKGYAETSIAQTRCGNLIFVGFNNPQGFCNSNPQNHSTCPGPPDGSNNGVSGYSVSFDGGTTWKYMYAPPFLGTNYYTRGDPWFSIGGKSSKHSAEILYFASLATDATVDGGSLGLVVHVANIIYKHNDPRNRAINFEWIRASLIPKVEIDDFMDKEAIAADPFDPHKAYVSLTLLNSALKFDLQMYATSDAGVSWQGPVVLQDGYQQTLVWNQMTYPLVNADGEVYVTWYEFVNTWEDFLTSSRFMFVRSTDGGQTFSEKIAINPTFLRYNAYCQPPLAYNRAALTSQPTMDVFTNKKHKKYLHRIIAVYEYAFEADCAGPLTGFINETSFVLNSKGIGVSYSDDRGLTWNFIHPFREHIAERFVKRIFPSVSVSSDGRSVNIAYLQIHETLREDLPICNDIVWGQRTSFYHTFVDTYYIHSNDGGTSWSDPIKLNTESVDWCTTYSNIRPNYGDYMLGVTDLKGRLHLAAVTNGFTFIEGYADLTASDVIYYSSEQQKADETTAMPISTTTTMAISSDSSSDSSSESADSAESDDSWIIERRCHIGRRCERRRDCCTGLGYINGRENDIACSSHVNSKWEHSHSHSEDDRFCCVKNMAECQHDYECCGGKTRCIDYECHNAAQMSGVHGTLVNEGQTIGDILGDPNDTQIEVDIPWTVIIVAICAISLCVGLPCLLWIQSLKI